jgi:hypothetical protein
MKGWALALLFFVPLTLGHREIYGETGGDPRKYWNNADKTFSHIHYNRWLNSSDALKEEWKRTWLDKLPASPGVVAEYGIGGGLLGEMLLTELNATAYKGFDIADRQLDVAKRRLLSCCDKKRFDLVRIDRELRAEELRGVDTFVSQAVIQHFPTHEYTLRFLDAINAAPSVRWIMLQVRETQRVGSSVTLATSTTRRDLEQRLRNFRVEWQSAKASNGYVYYVFLRQ